MSNRGMPFDPVAFFRAERCAGEPIEIAVKTVAKHAYIQGKWDGNFDRMAVGYKLVPLEPTEEMSNIGSIGEHITPKLARKVYRAMVSAALDPHEG